MIFDIYIFFCTFSSRKGSKAPNRVKKWQQKHEKGNEKVAGEGRYAVSGRRESKGGIDN